jgi:hypothetical protein
LAINFLTFFGMVFSRFSGFSFTCVLITPW